MKREGKAHKGPYSELAGLAEALGQPYRGAAEVDALFNGFTLRLSLGIDSGTVTSVIATVMLPVSASAKLKFRKETATDLVDKAESVSVEVQAGHARFDEAVYVDSNAPDEEVQRVLSDPRLRDAVRALVLDGAVLEFEGAQLVVTWKLPDARAATETSRASATLQAVVEVARCGGVNGPATRRHGLWVFGVIALSVLLTISLITWNGRPDSWWVAAIGGLIGAFSAALLKRPLRWVMAGDSGSGERAAVAVALCVFLLGGVGFSLPTFLNRQYDRSPGVKVNGVVERIGLPDDDGHVTVEVRWSDGSTEERRWWPGATVGQHVTKVKQAGSLGISWSR